MAFLQDIKARIETLALNGWVVKRGEMPANPDKIIAIFQYPGNPPELGFSLPGLQYEYPGLQVSVRGVTTDYDGPFDMMRTIYQDLVKVQDTVLNSTRYLMITANQTPYLAARDGNQRCVWQCNFICYKEL